jgi:hypothetical protein
MTVDQIIFPKIVPSIPRNPCSRLVHSANGGCLSCGLTALTLFSQSSHAYRKPLGSCTEWGWVGGWHFNYSPYNEIVVVKRGEKLQISGLVAWYCEGLLDELVDGSWENHVWTIKTVTYCKRRWLYSLPSLDSRVTQVHIPYEICVHSAKLRFILTICIPYTNWQLSGNIPLCTLVFYDVWDYSNCMFRPVSRPVIMNDKRTCTVCVRISCAYRPRSPSLNTYRSNQYGLRSYVRPDEDY